MIIVAEDRLIELEREARKKMETKYSEYWQGVAHGLYIAQRLAFP
jgi:hypothetical protein